MNGERHQQLTEHFLRAAALDPAQRMEYLETIRSTDADLCAEVETLLRHEADIPPILESGALPALREALVAPPERIGPYHLVRRIGSGGMGVVYLAEQHEPLRREVALKLVRGGCESDQMLARFDAERRVLARMQHPNIARILDAGTTKQGLPYVVMEYVDGEPVTRFCDRNRLDVRRRLALFVQICDAVHYAHQNAIIHRDLKPSNILVARIGDRPVPKIIDFGVAKTPFPAGHGRGTRARSGRLIGTPAYMSPEQAAPDGDPVDIRTDVFSLGVLLYELLIGCTPWDPGQGDGRDLERMRRRLLREEAIPPGTKLMELGPPAAVVARNRSTDRRALGKNLHGDLDCIALKALARVRSARYGSASDLAADVQHYLRDELVQARIPTAVYRARKLVRRHRAAAISAFALVPILIAFAALMAILGRQVARQRDRAEEVSEALVRAYEIPFYVSGRHSNPDPLEVLRRSVPRIETELADRPVLRSRMLTSIGEALRGVGDSAAALPVLERAASELLERPGRDDAATLTAMNALARARQDRGTLQQAERLFRTTLRGRRRLLGDAHPDTLRTVHDLAVLYKRMARNEEAAPLLEEAYRGMRAALGDDSVEALTAGSLLASVYLDLGRLDAAESLLRRILPRLSDDFPEKGMARYNLACVHALRGEKEAALSELRGALDAGFSIGFFSDRHLKSLFDEPEFLAITRSADLRGTYMAEKTRARASCEIERGHYAAAESIYRDAIDALPSAVEASGYHRLLGELYLSRGRYREARAPLESWVDAHRRRLAPGGETVLAEHLWDLVQVDLGLGDTRRALETVDDVIRLLEGTTGLSSPPWHAYALACRDAIRGDDAPALAHLSEAVELGFRDVDLVRRDLALGSLRGMPDFESLLQVLIGRYEPEWPLVPRPSASGAARGSAPMPAVQGRNTEAP